MDIFRCLPSEKLKLSQPTLSTFQSTLTDVKSCHRYSKLDRTPQRKINHANSNHLPIFPNTISSHPEAILPSVALVALEVHIKIDLVHKVDSLAARRPFQEDRQARLACLLMGVLLAGSHQVKASMDLLDLFPHLTYRLGHLAFSIRIKSSLLKVLGEWLHQDPRQTRTTNLLYHNPKSLKLTALLNH